MHITMENKEIMSGQESLQIIQQMIGQAKRQYSDDSFNYLLWGWLVFIASLGQYILAYVGFAQPAIVWLLMPLGAVISTIYNYKANKKEKVKTYIDEFSVTGLTSNPTIFDQAIRSTAAYDNAIHKKVQEGQSGEGLFFELALEDLKRAALLFSSVHEATGGVDGWVSLEVSPLLVHDAPGTIKEAARLHTLAQCRNLFTRY